MRYFVVSEDGSKYGPADVGLLNEWIGEGRLLPVMILHEEGTNHPVTAASIDGLDFYSLEPKGATAANAMATPGEAVTLAFEPQSHQESETITVLLSWAMVAATLILSVIRATVGVLGVFTAILGLVAGLKAKDKGHEGAAIVIVFNLLALVVWCATRMYFLLG